MVTGHELYRSTNPQGKAWARLHIHDQHRYRVAARALPPSPVTDHPGLGVALGAGLVVLLVVAGGLVGLLTPPLSGGVLGAAALFSAAVALTLWLRRVTGGRR